MRKLLLRNGHIYYDQNHINNKDLIYEEIVQMNLEPTTPSHYSFSKTSKSQYSDELMSLLNIIFKTYNLSRLKLSFSIILLITFSTVYGQVIQNDVFWKDTNGNPIYSQGGGVLKVGDTYYWYGAKYRGAITYYNNPYSGKNGDIGFIAITCYSSKDLVNWKDEGDVLRAADIPHSIGWLGRVGIAYNKNTRQYVLISQLNESILFATNDSPTGRFAFRHTQDRITNVVNDMSGDQSVFTDDDGQAYLIYCNRKGRSYQYVSRLRPSDFLHVETPTNIYRSNGGREGNVMFKHKGTYYFITSDLHGWNTSHTYVATAKNIFGPYTPEIIMEGTQNDYSHVTQCGLAVQVNGTSGSFVIFGGDRWANFAGNGVGYNQWVPITFDGTKPIFHSLSQWHINAKEGTWSVGAGNNYVMNPNIEADRVNRTGNLVGWTSWTNLTSGNPNGNTQSSHFPGRFSMSQHSTSAYQATLYQNISIPNGTYTLSAWVKSSGGQKKANIYVKNFGGSERNASINRSMNSWTEITISNIIVSNGTIEVGVFSDANSGNWVNVDDFSLVKISGTNDCNGIANGTAVLDACGTCVGGNTGKTACSAAIQGEDFCTGQGTREITNTGFIGDGYFDFDYGPGSSATWNIISQSDLSVDIIVRYANGGASSRRMSVSVNGTHQATLSATSTGGWTTWTTEVIKLNLIKGSNNIVLTATSEEGGPNIDLFALTDTRLSAGSCIPDCNRLFGGEAFIDSCGVCAGGNTGKAPCSQDCYGDWGGKATTDQCGICVGGNSINKTCVDSLEAESSCFLEGTIDNNNSGFSGYGFVNTDNFVGAAVSWVLHSITDQTATLAFRYANGSSTPRNGELVINGVNSGIVNLPPTGNWSTWRKAFVNINLVSGSNDVLLKAASANGLANLDVLYLSSGVSEEVCTITSLNNSSTKISTVYPSPTSGRVNWTGTQKWILLNSLGKEIGSGTGTFADLSVFPTGMYFIKLPDGTYPVIKE